MADKAISDLTAATQVTSADLFVLEQNNTAKKLTGQILMNDLATALDGHGGINSIVYTAPVAPDLTGTLTITLADETDYTLDVENGNGISSVTQYWATSEDNSDAPSVWYTTLQTMTATFRYLWSYTNIAFSDGTDIDTTPQVIGVYGDKGDSWYVHIKYAGSYPTQDSDIGDTPDEWVGVYSGTSATAPTSYTAYTWYGWKGPRGLTGNGITSVSKTSSSGLVDYYTVLFDDGNTASFTVTNGSNISTISKTSSTGLQDTYTVLLTNGQTTTFTVNNGKSITSIAWASTTSPSGVPHVAGATDTYVISYNDNDTSSFQVYNGANGAGTVAKVDGISSVGDNVPLLTIANGPPTTATAGSVKSRYFDALNSILYICVAYDSGTGTYTWQGTGVTVDSALSTSSTNPVQNKVITGKVGTTTLTTTATNLSDAVNEIDAEVGDVSQMTTTATDLASAVNELDGDISTINTAISGIPAELANRLKLDGTSVSLWMGNTHNLNDFYSGVVLVDEYVQNVPTADWWLVISAGNDISTRTQVAYSLWNTSMPRTRHCASGTWSAWESIPAVNKTGDTMTGSLGFTSANLDMDGTVPSSITDGAGFRFYDKDGVQIGVVTPTFMPNGFQGVTIGSHRVVGGSDKWNVMRTGIDSNGNCAIEMGSSEATAWKSALGLTYAVNDTFSTHIPLNGFITSGTKRATVVLQVPKSLENISTVTITAMSGSIRGISGYVDSTTDATNLKTTYTCTASKESDNAILIVIDKSTAFTNATNNTPATVYATITLKFT